MGSLLKASLPLYPPFRPVRPTYIRVLAPSRGFPDFSPDKSGGHECLHSLNVTLVIVVCVWSGFVSLPNERRVQMSYQLALTESEESTLRWLEDRGYDCGLYAALKATGETTEAGESVYTIAEHKMWDVAETAGFGPGCGAFDCLDWYSTLGIKIQDLLNEIV